MQKTEYVVTDVAGTHVAGRKVKAGERLLLTETEARYELDTGKIVKASAVRQSGDAKSAKVRD